ncbi:MAG TPA: GAF domain-containing sensor histidine kinase [Chroococcidiopsis sp.]
MLSPEGKLLHATDALSDLSPDLSKEQRRLHTLSASGLLELHNVPVFDEATHTAAHLLDAPICILSCIDETHQWLKSAVGLSRVGLINDAISARHLPRSQSLCAHVVDSQHVLIVNDVQLYPGGADSLLVQRYGVRSYLGVPLMAANGDCLGTLAIMDVVPRQFTSRDVSSLELVARWSMSELERERLQTLGSVPATVPATVSATVSATSRETAIQTAETAHPVAGVTFSPTSVKADLLTQMTQELRTPLTSVLGMASVLTREIYGPLTEKQREYMNIIRNSGQYLLSLVNEVLELGALDDHYGALNLSSVDVEMLCQQACSTLEQIAQRRELQLRLTVEPGPRIWLLDKDRVRQIIYHLVFSVIQSATTESVIRIHISRKSGALNITVWTSHPWLGEGLPQAELRSLSLFEEGPSSRSPMGLSERYGDFEEQPSPTSPAEAAVTSKTRQSLGLMLSRQLAEVHGGKITLQGSHEIGYRYVISLPQLTEPIEKAS